MSNPARPYSVMFSAGEASGDRHGAELFLEMRKRLPDMRGIGMGGKQMAAAGVELVYDSTPIGVIGVVEVLAHYFEIRRALRLLQQCLLRERPDLLVCVDYKEFNFKLAQFAKRQGIKVLFYVSPQVWAWRPGRVKQYGAVIDYMAVIFPFETAYYEAEQIPVRYVGHPSVDKVRPSLTKPEALARYGLDGGKLVIGLLPGSRVNEVKRLLPEMLAAAKLITAAVPQAQFVLAQADSIDDALLLGYLSQSTMPVRVVKGEPYDMVQCCTAVLTASGTATLEVALLEVPMLIVYKLNALTYWLGRLLVNTPFIGLPNIVAGKGIVKELIQDQATAANMAAEAIKILEDADYAAAMRANLAEVKAKLGPGGGSKNMAELAVQLLTDCPSLNQDSPV